MRVGRRVITSGIDFLTANEFELPLIRDFLQAQCCGSGPQVTEIDICGNVLAAGAGKDFAHRLEPVLGKVGPQGSPGTPVIELRKEVAIVDCQHFTYLPLPYPFSEPVNIAVMALDYLTVDKVVPGCQ